MATQRWRTPEGQKKKKKMTLVACGRKNESRGVCAVPRAAACFAKQRKDFLYSFFCSVPVGFLVRAKEEKRKTKRFVLPRLLSLHNKRTHATSERHPRLFDPVALPKKSKRATAGRFRSVAPSGLPFPRSFESRRPFLLRLALLRTRFHLLLTTHRSLHAKNHTSLRHLPPHNIR